MSNRRKFIEKLVGVGLSLPLIPNLATALGRNVSLDKTKAPFVLCSRGEYWGKKVLEPAWEKLKSGSILDAVEVGANVVELDPTDQSVGYGGLPNEDGVVQLDASIMYGPTHGCGSVMAIEGIKTPCSVARLVMERTNHIQLAGEGAQRFAVAHGFKVEDLLTDKSRRVWLKWKENLSDRDDWLPPEDGDYGLKRPTGTINVLGIDGDGKVAGITTTSGLFAKIPGRVGDSPVIGAGLYLENSIGAAGATGLGEQVIRTCGSFYVVQMMGEGKTPQEACELACKKIIDINGGPSKIDFNDKYVAFNVNGEVGCAQVKGGKNSPPELSYYSSEGFKVVKGTNMIES